MKRVSANERRHGQIRIGISGWRYAPWRGVFYPDGLRQREELRFAASHFPTIEINGTFYSLQRPEFFARWAEEVPADFLFAVKGPRYITHMRRLRGVETPLANFFASGILRLGPKLGPVLWQFPPNFKFDAALMTHFFELLPRDTKAAARLARKHDRRFADRVWIRTDENRPLRHAIEIRHDSFRSPDFVRLLRRHRVGLVCADTVEWPRLMDVTADFVYCRLHGSTKLYESAYADAALRWWADCVVAWAQGREPDRAERVIDKPARKRTKRDVFVYFDNDIKVKAPRDAASLIARVERRMDGTRSLQSRKPSSH